MQPAAGSSAANEMRLPVLAGDDPFAVADAYRRAALSGATMSAYRTDWSHFADRCAVAAHRPLPADPDVVGAYLAHLGRAGSSASTLGRRLAAINKVHQWAGLPRPGVNPAVTLVMEGFRRSDERPVRRMAPLLLADLTRMLSALDTDSSPQGALGRRDRVLLLFGWALACRRGELTALRITDVTPTAGGLAIRIRRSKTDQRGRGLTKGLPCGRTPLTCPVCAYCDWRRLSDAADRRGRVGVLAALERHATSTDHDHDLPADDDLDADRPVLRGVRAGGHLTGAVTGHAVNLVVKRRLPDDLDPARFGAHSLRAGFITEAARRGATGREIRRQTGQSSDRVVEIYIRENDPLAGNAVTAVGL
ncbi:site-specific integrase [Nakamurella multipartita]|uniref:Integrase domain protein SAM domain protein n=1 Tax=Nakamurella multipartita (strain ATCC 700099 / DSM 44233 / CIP 104796 / JCM 9543 / NBRC 105858 / Y-104) TaxID=479431 RepID=C8X8P3_NAKMY|nr:site-specific integrase [Nakamurella multipartita]ACV79098.1 integrase domain protein SAM domain protein [Nakamurella multipartita DSM 44233]